MGILMELRCEGRDGPAPARCLSNQGTLPVPLDLAEETPAAVLAALQALEASARKAGWVKTPAGWTCPACSAGQQPQG
jgi:hypothetical protein